MDVLDQNERKGTGRLDGANGVLASGIASIIFISIIGVLLAVSTLIRASSLISEYERFPSRYNEKYYKRVKAGKTCAIVGLLIKLVGILVLIIVFN